MVQGKLESDAEERRVDQGTEFEFRNMYEGRSGHGMPVIICCKVRYFSHLIIWDNVMSLNRDQWDW